MYKKVSVLVFVMVMLSPAVQAAEALSRADRWEFYLQSRWIDGQTLDTAGPSEVTTSDDNTWAFGFGYNFSNRLSLSGEFAWGSVGYTANTVDENSNPVNLGGNLDTGSTMANLTYYFSEGHLAPFVSAQAGAVFVDSNIPSGPPGNVCWWDPWLGYVCSSSQPTYATTNFGYGLAAGIRWDGPKGFFLRGSIGENWINFDSVSGTPGFGIFRFDVGSVF
jgi:hypothetical protein